MPAPKVGEHEEFRLPRSTSNRGADWAAAARAYRTSTTDAQRAAVQLRMQSLRERDAAALAAFNASAAASVAAFCEAVRQAGEQLRPVLQAYFDHVTAAARLLYGTLPADQPPPTDPRERALRARRNRNTGPPVRQRPPRRIDPRGVYR